MSNTIRELFARTVEAPEEDIDLAWAALLIAKEEYPRMNPNIHVAQLDGMAADIAAGAEGLDEPRRAVEAINRRLFGELGFRGNSQDYYDPRNSFLSDVMDRKLGIPITLSLVYMEVAKRIGLPMAGVGMPGHFLLRPASSKEDWYVDAFSGGKILSTEDCAERLKTLYKGNIELRPEFLDTVNKRQFLFRMLANLKGVYLARGDFTRALAAIDRMLVLEPDAPEQVRDRGGALSRLERFTQAVASLERYLVLVPDAPDADSVKDAIDSAWRQMAGLN